MLDKIQNYGAVRARLTNPLGAVVDTGIDLKRPKKPPVFVPIMQIGKPLAVPITATPAPVIEPYKLIYFPQEERHYVSISDIQTAVCQHFGILHTELLSARRTLTLSWPRQVAMYLARTLTLRSYPHIGRKFGGRDHTTCMWGVRKVEQKMALDAAIKAEIESLQNKILGERHETLVA